MGFCLRDGPSASSESHKQGVSALIYMHNWYIGRYCRQHQPESPQGFLKNKSNIVTANMVQMNQIRQHPPESPQALLKNKWDTASMEDFHGSSISNSQLGRGGCDSQARLAERPAIDNGFLRRIGCDSLVLEDTLPGTLAPPTPRLKSICGLMDAGHMPK